MAIFTIGAILVAIGTAILWLLDKGTEVGKEAINYFINMVNFAKDVFLHFTNIMPKPIKYIFFLFFIVFFFAFFN